MINKIYDELSTHSFDKFKAKKYGIGPAVLYEYIRHTIEYNAIHDINIEPIDDINYNWTYDSAKKFAIAFPYIPANTIGRYLRKLEKEGEIVSDNFNKKGYDKTKWYTIPRINRMISERERENMRYVNVFDAIQFRLTRAVILTKIREEVAVMENDCDDNGSIENKDFSTPIKQKRILERLPFFTDRTLINSLNDLKKAGVIKIKRNNEINEYSFTEKWLSKQTKNIYGNPQLIRQKKI